MIDAWYICAKVCESVKQHDQIHVISCTVQHLIDVWLSLFTQFGRYIIANTSALRFLLVCSVSAAQGYTRPSTVIFIVGPCCLLLHLNVGLAA